MKANNIEKIKLSLDEDNEIQLVEEDYFKPKRNYKKKLLKHLSKISEDKSDSSNNKCSPNKNKTQSIRFMNFKETPTYNRDKYYSFFNAH